MEGDGVGNYLALKLGADMLKKVGVGGTRIKDLLLSGLPDVDSCLFLY
jgi:hypothetical protein